MRPGYDARGNLAKVIQGTQTRFFMYDAAGRLVRVRQPEQSLYGLLGDLTDPVTGNNT
jgi:YD repeat-containing protein